jgi:hypothetical protein
LHVLDPESEAELERLCEMLGKAGEQLRRAVERVCENPSGQRNPRHRYTKKFQSPHRYVNVSKGAKVMEFTTNQWRGLFQLVEVEKEGKIHRLVAFVPVSGRRFFTKDDCPWH